MNIGPLSLLYRCKEPGLELLYPSRMAGHLHSGPQWQWGLEWEVRLFSVYATE